MKNKIYILLFLAIILATNFQLKAQDIIILNSGELVKSKVLEITLNQVKYKRFDQISGLVYSLVKNELFAIHYEDGTKDVFSNVDNRVATINEHLTFLVDTANNKEIPLFFMEKKKIVHFGIGLHKLYSPVNEIGVDSYKIQSPFLSLSLGFGLNSNIVLRIMYGQGSFFAEKTFTDNYAFTSTTYEISQKTSSFNISTNYYIQTRYDNLRVYANIGISLNNSVVEVLTKSQFNDQTIDFSRGGRIMDLFPLMRAGLEFDISKNIGFYTEVGYGITLVSLGVSATF